MNADRPLFVTPGAMVAVVATSIAGLVQAWFGEPTALVAVFVSGTVTLLLGTAGLYWAERQPGTARLAQMIFAYASGIVVTLLLSHGQTMLLSMPLVSVAVLFISLRAAIAVGLAITAAFAAMVVHWASGGWAALPPAVAGTLAAFGFVAAFSLVARRERYARRDVERMSAELEVLATSRERNRIAREIHDSLGHYLTVASVQLEAARTSADQREERIARVAQLLRDGLGELRRSVSMLREGPATPQPFTSAIAELVSDCNAAGLPAALSTSGDPRPLSGSVGFTLYRVAQEALTNARRHSAAKQVRVDLDYDARKVKLTVVDDGKGFSPQVQHGNGLKGVRERVELVGGTVALEATPGGGVTVRVEVSV